MRLLWETHEAAGCFRANPNGRPLSLVWPKLACDLYEWRCCCAVTQLTVVIFSRCASGRVSLHLAIPRRTHFESCRETHNTSQHIPFIRLLCVIFSDRRSCFRRAYFELAPHLRERCTRSRGDGSEGAKRAVSGARPIAPRRHHYVSQWPSQLT